MRCKRILQISILVSCQVDVDRSALPGHLSNSFLFAFSIAIDAGCSLGGGVLYTGCVQEEIRFCLSPECVVSMILCEMMADNESIILIGPNMYSQYKGYGGTLEFGSNLPNEGLELDEFGRTSTAIVAIDAIDFCNNDGSVLISPKRQWDESAMARESMKAFVGFSFEQRHLGSKFQYDSIATGNWVSTNNINQ